MSKTFKYTKFTGHYYCQYSDEWEEDGVEFDYEVEDKDLLPVIVDLIFEDYFVDDEDYCDDERFVQSIKKKISKMVEEQDLIGVFADNYEESLKDIFQDVAMEWYN